MARMPTHYNGLRIVRRIPYAMFTECYLWRSAAGADLIASFPLADLVHDVDKPFEIHRMIPVATNLIVDGGTGETAVDYAATTQLDYLQGADVEIRDNAKNVAMTKGLVTLANLVRGPAAQTWEWEAPYYLTRGEGLLVNAVESAFTPVGTDAVDHVAIRYMLAFEGSLVVVEGV